MIEEEGPLAGRGWLVDTAVIGPGKAGRIEANIKECAAVAAALDLRGCANLVLDYDLRPLSRTRFRLRAGLTCDVVQSCVVTLEPVPAKIKETYESELMPDGDPATTSTDEALDVLGAPVIDTYVSGRIDFDRIAFELLSVSLDPYPKAPGAALAEDGEADRLALSPFAALAKLRKEQGKS